PRRDGGCCARPGTHDRRGTERAGVQAIASVVRYRRRSDDVAARQRDHVLGASGKTNEAGGLQGTAQNLGASLGTALIGSVLLAGLLTGFNTRILENPAYSESTKTQITAATEQGIEIVTTDQVHAAALDAG